MFRQASVWAGIRGLESLAWPEVSRLEAGELITLSQLEPAGPEPMFSKPAVIRLPLLWPDPPPAGGQSPQYERGEALSLSTGLQFTLLTLHIA